MTDKQADTVAEIRAEETDYAYWLRDMANRESMPIRPCPKALRRAADKLDALQARVEELETMLRRYRAEVPLGHQPHMIADSVDELLGDSE